LNSHRLNRKRFIAALVLGLTTAAIVYVSVRSSPPDVDVATHSVTVADAQRTYRLVVPQQLSAPCPVLIAFHGIGDSADSMADYSRLDRLASDHGFLLVYPSARRSMWATMNIDPDALDANVDIQFVDSMLDDIASRHEVDTTRIYLIGMSNGASFAQLVAHARSDDVAAVVACSGSRPRSLHQPQHQFPILMIAGSGDSVVDLMQSDLDYYRDAGHQTDLIVVRGMGHEWSVRHNSTAWDFLSACKR
jgi:poly(3-hydroxybutyrate) depolymerase